MAKGDKCKGLDCEATQPCPDHTSKGRPRRNARQGDNAEYDNVHELFTDEKQQHVNGMRPPGGKGSTQPKEQREADTRKQRYVKQRLGKRWSQIHDEVKAGMYTWDEFVENLDAEELARAQLKADDGTFRGRPPEFIPRTFYLACQREMVGRFNRKIQSNFEKATDELIRLGTSDIMDPKDRIKVLQYLIERVVGKIPDKVEVAVADPWETIIGDILAEAPEGVTIPQYMDSRAQEKSDG